MDTPLSRLNGDSSLLDMSIPVLDGSSPGSRLAIISWLVVNGRSILHQHSWTGPERDSRTSEDFIGSLSLFPSLHLRVAVSRALSQNSIDPNSVPLSTRDQWCQSQKTSCPLICLQLPGVTGQPEDNSCNPKTLSFSCVCSNGQQPNSSEYSQTLPYFICTEANNQCVNNCNGESSCQAACRDDHPCGAQNPKRYNITTTSATSNPTASASSTSGGNVVYTGFGSASTAAAKKGDASTFALEIGQVYGLFGLVAGFLGGFAYLL
ncbi:hypothetical protein DTO166G4_2704 [Paecilomyces variotii]|nr:hypothetical protein DTO166G4_2704 [Paecilomyces variotii]KAJ9223757.1 hypothetical protein DTO169C6_3871 [Paecilomyces variotii]KAJ9232823.1 hypothetical protein DTO166G5_6024 [Paecilomyces variotii]KAJ9253752.1 hypothetical protein DTO195F2_6973 [Paecilomyces variotii]KAJ9304682.1 hypothetical protein DTO217A2_5793 [Paecilomyces variotii]